MKNSTASIEHDTLNKMKIYVMRHGQTELNKQNKVNGEIDEPLAPEGIEQAKTAASLIPNTIRHIYSSPMLRTRQTTEIINTLLKRSTTFHPELTEIHMGSLAGYGWTEMKKGLEMKKKHRSIQFDYHPYGGESVADVKARVFAFLKSINGKYKDKEILLVVRGGIIRLLYFFEHNTPFVDKIEHVSPQIFDIDVILQNS